MGGVNITDPLVLEERILDLQYRNRHLERELKFLRAQSTDQSRQQKKIKELSKNILKLEAEDKETIKNKKEAENNLETDIQK